MKGSVRFDDRVETAHPSPPGLWLAGERMGTGGESHRKGAKVAKETAKGENRCQ
jgi:hypothetical protein